MCGSLQKLIHYLGRNALMVRHQGKFAISNLWYRGEAYGHLWARLGLSGFSLSCLLFVAVVWANMSVWALNGYGFGLCLPRYALRHVVFRIC